MKYITRITAIAFIGLVIAACNTVAGAGEDVSAVGHDVTKAAKAA